MAIDATMTGAATQSSDRIAPEQRPMPKLLSLADAQERLIAGVPLMPSETISLDRTYGRVSSDDITPARFWRP